MKTVVLLIICGCVFYIGCLFTSYYKRKLQIFSDLIKLCDLLESQIKFKKELVPNILLNNKKLFCSDFNMLIDEMYFKSSKQNIGYLLTYNELKIVHQFFDSIGMLDVDNEINNLKANSENFKSILNDLKTNKNGVGELGIKLGVLMSILIFIIFI